MKRHKWRAFDAAVRHAQELRRPRMDERRYRRLTRTRLGTFDAGMIVEVLQELGRARAVEREARRELGRSWRPGPSKETNT